MPSPLYPSKLPDAHSIEVHIPVDNPKFQAHHQALQRSRTWGISLHLSFFARTNPKSGARYRILVRLVLFRAPSFLICLDRGWLSAVPPPCWNPCLFYWRWRETASRVHGKLLPALSSLIHPLDYAMFTFSASITFRLRFITVVVSDPAKSNPTTRLSSSSTAEPESPPALISPATSWSTKMAVLPMP